MEYEDEQLHPSDIASMLEAVRLAWETTPYMSLDALLDAAVPAPMVDMTESEIIFALREYAHVNRKL